MQTRTRSIPVNETRRPRYSPAPGTRIFTGDRVKWDGAHGVVSQLLKPRAQERWCEIAVFRGHRFSGHFVELPESSLRMARLPTSGPTRRAAPPA